MVTPKLVSELRKAAQDVQKRAYSPYSKALVGSAVLTSNGKMFTGCNIENGSYGATVCAERVAIFSAVAQGEREIKAVYVYTDEGWPPCALCRQVMKEFASDDLVIIIGAAKGEDRTYTLDQIYPLSFGPKDMGI